MTQTVFVFHKGSLSLRRGLPFSVVDDRFVEIFELFISTNHFIRNFKQHVGLSPMQYVVSIRMTNAQALLENENYPVREIASIVGYNDPLYFGQVFKREIGMPPSKYRKMQRKGSE